MSQTQNYQAKSVSISMNTRLKIAHQSCAEESSDIVMSQSEVTQPEYTYHWQNETLFERWQSHALSTFVQAELEH